LRSLNKLVCVLLVFSLPVCQPAGATVASDATDASYNAGVHAWRKKDYPEAAKQWSLAALSGNVDAMNNLAFLYSNGLGMKPRISDAISLWRVAAYAGHSEAQWHLGVSYEDGNGVEKDTLKAYAWYRCAVESARRKKDSDKSGTEATIEQDGTRSIEGLVTRISPGDLNRANALADEYIRRYGRAMLP
jgi:hypothetical protein